MTLKLIEIKKSPRANKKWRAEWNDGSYTDFGHSDFQDFTQHHDKTRRTAYRSRHKNDNLQDPQSAGSLSYYILWGDSIDFQTNLKSFKRRFAV